MRGTVTILATIAGVSLSVISLPQQTELSAATALARRETRRVAEMYQAMSSVPVNQRRVLYASLEAGRKSQLWTMQLRLFLTTHPELSDEQKSIINELITLAGNAQLFSAEPNPATTEADGDALLNQLGKEFRELFPRPHWALIHQLGPTDPMQMIAAEPAAEQACATTTASPELSQTTNATPKPTCTPDCECYPYDDYCWICFLKCVGGGCYFSKSGCGTFWRKPCTGMCRPLF